MDQKSKIDLQMIQKLQEANRAEKRQMVRASMAASIVGVIATSFLSRSDADYKKEVEEYAAISLDLTDAILRKCDEPQK